MKLKEITIGKSQQIWKTGQPESWNKFSITAELEDAENVENAIEKLNKIVDDAHQKYSKSEYPDVFPQKGDLYFNVIKNKEEVG